METLRHFTAHFYQVLPRYYGKRSYFPFSNWIRGLEFKGNTGMMKDMIITTTETVPGKEVVEILGVARGSSVRARHIGRDITAALKNIVGGEIEEYTALQAQSREQALQRMVEDAEKMGADAVIGLRMMTSMVAQGAAEILIYGTAVRLK